MSEEKKQKKGKLGLIMAIVGVLAVIAVVCICLLCKKEEVYRNIRITELEGEVSINRGDTKELKATENMNLQSGDELMTEEGAKVTLCLDDDKYIVVDEVTKLVLVAEGTEEDSRTKIELEYGAVFSDIKNKLSENSEYKVVAPSGVMSVRGTQFEVVCRELRDEAGKLVDKVMKVLTFEGEVYVKPEGSAEKRVSKAGTMEVLSETADGEYEFAAETKVIEAEDLSELSATYLREDLSKNQGNLSEEEKAIKGELLEKINKYFEGIASDGDGYRPEDHQYSFVPIDGMTWEEMNEYCKERGGHLAIIQSEEENKFLYDKMVECGFFFAYFGLTDEAVEGDWKWVTGDEVTYTNWYKDDVDNYREEDYAMIWVNRPYYWNDGGLREAGDTAAFICEWEVDGTGTVIVPTPTTVPTPTPAPTPTVAPDPSQAAGPLSLQVYLPKVLKLENITVSDMEGLYEALKPYEKSIMSANVEEEITLQDDMNVWLNNIADMYVEGEGDVKAAAEAFYGKDVVILCNGFYSESDNDKIYGLEEHCTFAEFGLDRSYLTLYPVYTVYVPEDNISHRYVPVRMMTEEYIAETGDDVNLFYTFMVQEDTTIGVPNVDGFDLSWIRGGMTPESREFDVLEDQLSWPILYAEKQEASTEVSSDILAQGTCRLQISVPNLVKDPSMPAVSDMDALYRALEPYQILQMSFAMEDVFVGDPVGRWLEQIDGGYITSDTGLKNGIEAVFGESVRVYSDGYISLGDLTWYSAADTNTFASYGVTQGDLLELYPCYTVERDSDGARIPYVYCKFILEENEKRTTYGMMFPERITLILPEIDGYEFYWNINGETMYDEKLEVSLEKYNTISLSVK